MSGIGDAVGGLVGYNGMDLISTISSTIDSCYSSGTTVSGGEAVGGLVGNNKSSTIENCSASDGNGIFSLLS